MSIKKYLVDSMLKSWERRDNKVLAQQTIPDGIVEMLNLPYINDGQRGHLLDIYYPQDATENLPVIIDIHGGGFLYGFKEMNRLYGCHLAKRGYIVFNLNYRLAFSETKLPGQLQDIAAALCWIVSHLDDYPADKNRVFVTGESAGGHLAVMAALASKSERLQQLFCLPPFQLDIKALYINCGLMTLDDKSIGYWGMRSMCLDKGYKKQEYYKNLVFRNIPEMKALPPVFLTSGEQDELRQMTLDFKKTLEDFGVDHRLRYFEQGSAHRLGHMFSVLHPDYEESDELITEMLAFLREKATAPSC